MATIHRLNDTAPSINSTQSHGAYDQRLWSGGFSIASVDLIAMVVSDAGLASTEPQWWNASPLGCMLIGAQPRGGWQVLQRAVQWGSDSWARCFGVDCKMPHVYGWFACSARNRLEVWRSKDFLSATGHGQEGHAPQAVLEQESVTPVPTVKCCEQSSATSSRVAKESDCQIVVSLEPDPEKGLVKQTSPTQISSQTSISKKSGTPTGSWLAIDRGVRGVFAVKRPTKLVDGSRGGQAFMCALFSPKVDSAYGIEEQSRQQFLSVLLVVAGLTSTDQTEEFISILKRDFGLSNSLSSIFARLLPCLLVMNIFVLGFSVSVLYALWDVNIYGRAAPYAIQLCSLLSWTSGAVGLLMLGGHPRVKIDSNKPAAEHIQERLNQHEGSMMKVEFGSLHGSVFVKDSGSCVVPTALVHDVARWRLMTVRSFSWYFGVCWFAIFLFLGVVLQITGSKVATVRSEILSIVLLVLAALLRGAGLSGSEEWTIPRWKRWQGAQHSVSLQGRLQSRQSKAGA